MEARGIVRDIDSMGRVVIPKEIRNDPYEIKRMLEKAHKQQLAYYSYAIEKIFGRKPDKIYIYSLAYGDTFEIQI